MRWEGKLSNLGINSANTLENNIYSKVPYETAPKPPGPYRRYTPCVLHTDERSSRSTSSMDTVGSLYLAQPLVLSISIVSTLTWEFSTGAKSICNLESRFQKSQFCRFYEHKRSHSGYSVIRTRSRRFAMHLPRPLQSSSPTSWFMRATCMILPRLLATGCWSPLYNVCTSQGGLRHRNMIYKCTE